MTMKKDTKMNCTHNHPLTTSQPTVNPSGGLRYVDTCSRCGATRTRDIAHNMLVTVGGWRR